MLCLISDSTHHAEKIPEGSVWYRRGTWLPLSKPTIRVLMPNGRTPPRCVYRCCTPATCFVMYSMVTGSSRFRRCDWASNLALSTRMRASALRPAKARQTWVSMRPILEGVMRVSCSFIAERFSQPSTTISLPLTPTAHVPLLTASPAYSTWKTCPSGLEVVSMRYVNLIGLGDGPEDCLGGYVSKWTTSNCSWQGAYLKEHDRIRKPSCLWFQACVVGSSRFYVCGPE